MSNAFAKPEYVLTNSLQSVPVRVLETKAAMLTTHNSVYTAINNKICAFGGVKNGGALSQAVEEYDPLLNTWTGKTNRPTVRQGFVLAVVNYKFYLIGGETETGGWLQINEEYDPIIEVYYMHRKN